MSYNYHNQYQQQPPPHQQVYGQYQQPQQQLHPIDHAVQKVVSRRPQWGGKFQNWLMQSQRISQCYQEFEPMRVFLAGDSNPVDAAATLSVLSAYLEWLVMAGAQYQVPETILDYGAQQQIRSTYARFRNPQQQQQNYGHTAYNSRPAVTPSYGYSQPPIPNQNGVNNLGFTQQPQQPQQRESVGSSWGSVNHAVQAPGVNNNPAIRGVTGGGANYTVQHNTPNVQPTPPPVQQATNPYIGHRNIDRSPDIRNEAVRHHRTVSTLLINGSGVFIPNHQSVVVDNGKGGTEQLLLPIGVDVDKNLHLGLTPQAVLDEKIEQYVRITPGVQKVYNPVTREEKTVDTEVVEPYFSLTNDYGEPVMHDVDLIKDYIRVAIDDRQDKKAAEYVETVQGAALQMQLDSPEEYLRPDSGLFVVDTWQVGHELPVGPLTEKMIEGLKFVHSFNDAVRFIQRLPDSRITRWLDRQLTENFNLYGSLRIGLPLEANILSVRDLPQSFDVEGAVRRWIDPDDTGQPLAGHVPYKEELDRITRAWTEAITYTDRSESNEQNLISYWRHVGVALVGLQLKDLPLRFDDFPNGRLVYMPGVLGSMDGYIIRTLKHDNAEFVYVVTEDDITLEFSCHGGDDRTADFMFVRIVNRAYETEYISQLYQTTKRFALEAQG